MSVDGKVVTTLRLLLGRPGALTAEYLRGRRARFLPPLRLYLLCSLAFFLVPLALRRVYGGGWGGAIGRSAGLSLVYGGVALVAIAILASLLVLLY